MGFDHHERQKEEKDKKKTTSNESIYSCLDQFGISKQLGKGNEWYCNKCKDHVNATKKLEIFSVPPILVLSI
jgi:ubiquitin carboxyl-terminal hydrolase 4/11/15